MAAGYPDLFAFLGKLSDKLDELTEIQKDKTLAVRRDDLMGVDACMKKEQAISLSLRSMEQQRLKLLRELGLDSVPLSALERHCPPEQRQAASEAAGRLRSSYEIYRSAADVSRSTLEVNLHQIEQIIDAETRSEASGGSHMADIRA